MKRIVSIMMSISLLASTSLGATFTQVANGSSISIDVAQGTAVTIKALDIFGKIFSGWTISGATVSNPSLAEQTITMPSGNVTATANYTEASGGSGSSGGGSVRVNADTSGANAPVLGAGMTPVNWDGYEFVETTEANWKYNYNQVGQKIWSRPEGNGDAAWANAKTADGSLFVWIPRFSYKTTGTVANSNDWWLYNTEDSSYWGGPTNVEIYFSNGLSDSTVSGVTVHPAFTLGSKNLKGFWISKFWGSGTGNATSGESRAYDISFLPEKARKSFGTDTLSKYYNWNRGLDSHLIKDSEWGAMNLLMLGVGKWPSVVNCTKSCTSGWTHGENKCWSQHTGVAHVWYDNIGIKGSTTGNIYGIYDTSARKGEMVAYFYEYAAGNTPAGEVLKSWISDSTLKNYVDTTLNPGGDWYLYTGSNSSSGLGSNHISTPDASYPYLFRGGESPNTSFSDTYSPGPYTRDVTSTRPTIDGYRMVLCP